MGKTKEKTWMLIIETKSYRGLSCYRKVLFVSAPDHQVAKDVTGVMANRLLQSLSFHSIRTVWEML